MLGTVQQIFLTFVILSSTITTIINPARSRTSFANQTEVASNTVYLPFVAAVRPPITSASPSKFNTGWWIDRSQIKPSAIPNYASAGQTLVNMTGHLCWENQLQQNKDFLTNAAKNGMKAIVGLTCGSAPTLPTATIEKMIKDLLVDKPDASTPYTGSKAIAGWYIGDEPERFDVDPVKQIKPYYDALVRADPSGIANVPAHPVFISFDMWYYFDDRDWGKARTFFPYLNIVGMHAYPYWEMDGEFGGYEGRTQYDRWKRSFEDAKANGKDFIATCQGFGDGFGSVYRNPTYRELRYQAFSAVVLGIDKVLFWMDSYGIKEGMQPLVNQMVQQIQSIGAEMNAGETFSKKIGVSVTDQNKLVYRYGVNNNRGVILAINIAGRSSSSGGSSLNVTFTPPAGVTSVQVLNENRTSIAMSNGTFTDSFKPLEVHIYTFSLNGAQ